MDHRAEVAQFLRSRRDRITPDEAGIIGGGRRRVPGLRREEVAMLTRVSVEYYARMERGDLSGVSPEVLDSLSPGWTRRSPRTCTTSPALQGLGRLVDASGPESRRCDRACAGSWRRSPAHQCGFATGG